MLSNDLTVRRALGPRTRLAVALCGAGLALGPVSYTHLTFFMTAVPMSGLIGGPISGWIMSTFHGGHGLSGWQWLFLLEGIPSVIIGVLVLIYLDDRINKAKWLTANEKAVLIRNIAAEEQHKEDPPIRCLLYTSRCV